MKMMEASPSPDFGAFFRSKNEGIYPFTQKAIAEFGYARTALWVGLKFLGIGKGDRVLLPSYVCNVVLAPFNYLGIHVEYYDVSKDLRPDMDMLSKKISKGIKAVLAVNYFGFPQDWAEIKMLCKGKGVFLIEDNAHGFLSSDGGVPLGSFGDISIFSFRKTLQLPDGAALVSNIKDKEFNVMDEAILRDSSPVFILRQINRSIGDIAGLSPTALVKRLLGLRSADMLKEEDPSEEINLQLYEGKRSRISRSIIERTDVRSVSDMRRKAFEYWLAKIPEGEPVFASLPKGVVPYVFPVIVREREIFVKNMKENFGVQCFVWPTLPSNVTDHPAFYRQVVAVPVWRKHEN